MICSFPKSDSRKSHPAWSGLFCVFALMTSPAVAADPASSTSRMVSVSNSPGKPWAAMKVRTLADLPDIAPDPDGGIYGGKGKPDLARATGFFHTAFIDGRWWFIDPEGRLFIHQGVSTVRTIATNGAKDVLKQRFGTQDDWAKQTAAMLHENGFNGLGGWADDETLRPSVNHLVYTRIWNFMSSYGKSRGGTYQKPGHTGYPGDCPFIFDPEFPAFCEDHARKLAATRDDPWLLGHFTDNELPWSLKMLEAYLKLPAKDHGHIAADALAGINATEVAIPQRSSPIATGRNSSATRPTPTLPR